MRLAGVTKRFGPLVANDAISLTLHAGEILALLGENGAGKSTLMSILFGHYAADAGTIEIFGRPLAPGRPRAALAAGVGMVHQHFALADNMSVLDNVMLGTEPWLRPWSRRRAARAKLAEVSRRFGLAVDADARIADLSVGERQRVEIVKALYRGARILILDEPTAVLTPQESEALFDTLGQLVAGGLGIVFISHKLGEVLRVSHRVAVLRGGRLVAEMRTTDATREALAAAMVGHAVETTRRRPAASRGGVLCALRGVSAGGAGRDALRGIDLELHAGEIVALAGVSGNGQSTLAELLCGVRRAAAGSIELVGRPWPRTAPALVAAGVARIPEDRHVAGVVGDLPLWENAVSERIRTRAFARGGLVRRGAARAQAARIERAFDVRGAGLDSPARRLSGGNMQKLILGRALLAPEGAASPALVVAHQPTWGLDVGAVSFVHERLFAARDAGAAVLLISDDLDEIFALGDRIGVMHAGKLARPKPADEWTRESIGLAMVGAGSAETA